MYMYGIYGMMQGVLGHNPHSWRRMFQRTVDRPSSGGVIVARSPRRNAVLIKRRVEQVFFGEGLKASKGVNNVFAGQAEGRVSEGERVHQPLSLYVNEILRNKENK